MIITGYYLVVFILTSCCSVIYFWKWNKHVDICFSLIYCLLPLTAAGYYLASVSRDIGNALCGLKLTYLGGCYISLLGMAAICRLAKVNLPKWLMFFFVCLSSFVYVSVLSVGFTDIFYKGERLVIKYGAGVIEKEYGPVHAMFYPMLVFYVFMSLIALIYAFRKKNEASRKNLLLLFISVVFAMFSFFIGRMITDAVEWLPVALLADAVIYLLIVDRISLYNIGDTISETLIRDGDAGYISVDLKEKYLASTPTAKRLFPALENELVDLEFSDPELKENIGAWIDDFKKDRVTRDFYHDHNERIYRIQVKYLYDGKRPRGYQMKVEDDTEHRAYLKTLEDYNRNIKEELAMKNRLLEEKYSAEQNTPAGAQ